MVVASPTMYRAVVLLFGALVVSACSSEGEPACDLSHTVRISGVGFEFGNNDTAIPGATVSIAECPEISAVTDANGYYQLDVPDDSTVTLMVDYPGFPIMYLETFTTAGVDYEDVKLQMVSRAVYTLFAGILGVDPDPERCQIATTVNVKAIRGTTLEEHSSYGAHGIAGATLTMDPALDSSYGPVYFSADTVPDPELTETTVDGGVVWHNVPPGVYTIHTSHPTVDIRTFVVTCEPGRFINAGPPWGPHEL
jgi:hypothetical protein